MTPTAFYAPSACRYTTANSPLALCAAAGAASYQAGQASPFVARTFAPPHAPPRAARDIMGDGKRKSDGGEQQPLSRYRATVFDAARLLARDGSGQFVDGNTSTCALPVRTTCSQTPQFISEPWTARPCAYAATLIGNLTAYTITFCFSPARSDGRRLISRLAGLDTSPA